MNKAKKVKNDKNSDLHFADKLKEFSPIRKSLKISPANTEKVPYSEMATRLPQTDSNLPSRLYSPVNGKWKTFPYEEIEFLKTKVSEMQKRLDRNLFVLEEKIEKHEELNKLMLLYSNTKNAEPSICNNSASLEKTCSTRCIIW